VRDRLRVGPPAALKELQLLRQHSGRMPSRQERRRSERDAAKRAPAQAGAAGIGGAAAALANVHLNSRNPGGDWTTQAPDPVLLFDAVGAEVVKQGAGAGDREAQFSQGYRLLCEAGGASTLLGAASGPKADVGFALRTAQFPGRSPDKTRRRDHLTT